MADHSAPDPDSVVLTYDSESRLRHPGRFLAGFLRDLRHSGGAIRALVLKNLAQRYRYSSLGLLWVFAPPMVTAAALAVGQKANVIGAGVSALYAIYGVMMAQTFLESLNLLRGLFVANRQLMARDSTPVEAFALSSLVEESVHTAMRIGVVVMIFIFSYKPTFTPAIALVVPGFLGIMLVGGGIGLLLSPFTALKGDLDKAMALFPWIFFAVTPVFFNGGSVGLLRTIYALNPAAWVFDSLRHAAYGAPGSLWPVILVFPAGLLLCAAGMLWCRLARPYVMERSLH